MAIVLLGEDDHDHRTIVSLVLEKEGHEILPAQDGYEVVDIYKNKYSNIDIIILDYSLPGRDGNKCLQLIWGFPIAITSRVQKGLRAKIPILGYSRLDFDRSLNAYKRNVDIFLRAPFDEHVLIRNIEKLLLLTKA